MINQLDNFIRNYRVQYPDLTLCISDFIEQEANLGIFTKNNPEYKYRMQILVPPLQEDEEQTYWVYTSISKPL